MRLKSEKKALKNLKDRIMLLSRGITLPDPSTPVRHLQSSQGGPGPMGTVCYIGDAPGKHNSQMSLVIFPKDHYMAQYALPTTWVEANEEQKISEKKKKVLLTGDGIFLEKVQSKWQGAWQPAGYRATLSIHAMPMALSAPAPPTYLPRLSRELSPLALPANS